MGRTAIAFSHRPVVWFTSGASEVSRFSCMEFPDVRGVYDYAGPAQELALSLLTMLPSALTTASASRLQFFEARYPARLYPCLRFAVHLATPGAKLGAEWFATPFS